MTDDRHLTTEDVEREHLAQVDPRIHWAYVAVVLGASFVAMVLFIAVLGSTS